MSTERKILVVDDDAVIQRALSMKLKSAGYEVVVAGDGASAVSAARQGKPNVIVLDITFPPEAYGGVHWDGFLILSWLRRLEEAKDTAVIMISGDNTEAARSKAKAAGALAFYPKPLDVPMVLKAIEVACAVQQATSKSV